MATFGGVLLPVLSTILALFALRKDWNQYSKTWVRTLVAALIFAVGAASVALAVKSSQDSTAQTQRISGQSGLISKQSALISDQSNRIAGLTAAVDTANSNELQNTKVYTSSLERFSNKLSDLEAKVQTSELRAETAELRAELAKTQRALNPPQADLTIGFVTEPGNRERLEKSLLVTANIGEPVRFEISLANYGNVNAQAGGYSIRICSSCKFHSVPPPFTHLQGQPETERSISFNGSSAGVHDQNYQIELDVPDDLTSFPFDFFVGCGNCPRSVWQPGTITVTRIGKNILKNGLKPTSSTR